MPEPDRPMAPCMKTAGMDDAPRRAAAGGGFTLVELMVATAILALILGLLFTVVSQVSALWKHSSAEIEAFRA